MKLINGMIFMAFIFIMPNSWAQTELQRCAPHIARCNRAENYRAPFQNCHPLPGHPTACLDQFNALKNTCLAKVGCDSELFKSLH